MSQQPESGPPVLKLYAIELPDGSIAMNGPYVLATENEGQAGRMAHARDGQEIAFVREIQQAQGVGESGLDDLCQRLSEHGAKSGRRAATKRYNDGVPTHTEMLMGQAVDAIRRLATPQSSAPVVGDDLESKYNVLRNLLQRSWREVHIGTKKYQLTLTVTPEYLERIESALTGRG